MRIYFDRRDWWIGYYRGDRHHYVCPLPTVVIRWSRRRKEPYIGPHRAGRQFTPSADR